jgi:hypothetical protein
MIPKWSKTMKWSKIGQIALKIYFLGFCISIFFHLKKKICWKQGVKKELQQLPPLYNIYGKKLSFPWLCLINL